MDSHNNCPVALAANIIGDLWSILIIRDLLPETRRFTQLQASVIHPDTNQRINTRTLTNRLKVLEEMGILLRKHFDHEKPPRTEYSLTEQGKELNRIIDDLRDFGKKYYTSC